MEFSLLDGEAAARAAGLLAGLPGSGDAQVEGASASCPPERVDGLPRVLHALNEAGFELAGVQVRRPTLDDVFLALTGHALRDDQVAA